MADIPVKDLPEASSVNWGSLLMVSDPATDETFRTNVNTLSSSVSSVTASGTTTAANLEVPGTPYARHLVTTGAAYSITRSLLVNNVRASYFSAPATNAFAGSITINLDPGYSLKVVTPSVPVVPGIEFTEDGDIIW